MRLLNEMELEVVCGAEGVCTPGNTSGNASGNTYGGVVVTETVGDELINIYEGVVAATSHVFERVANALR
jgi:hypothetical protein